MIRISRFARLASISATALVACHSTGASAQSVGRAFVSVTGTDNGTCSTSAPCRTMNAAIAVVQSGGEVYCLTSGGYGSVSITKSVSLVCDRVDAALSPANGGAAVTIAAGPHDGVALQGLHISGFGNAGTGINYTSGAAVSLDQCVVSGFTQGTGVNVSGPGMAIKNSTIAGNLTGIAVNASANVSGVGVSNTLVGANQTAVMVSGGANGGGAFFDHSQIEGNGAAVVASGASQITFISSFVINNTIFFNLSGNATVYSYDNNQFTNNGGTIGPNTSGYTFIGSQ